MYFVIVLFLTSMSFSMEPPTEKVKTDEFDASELIVPSDSHQVEEDQQSDLLSLPEEILSLVIEYATHEDVESLKSLSKTNRQLYYSVFQSIRDLDLRRQNTRAIEFPVQKFTCLGSLKVYSVTPDLLQMIASTDRIKELLIEGQDLTTEQVKVVARMKQLTKLSIQVAYSPIEAAQIIGENLTNLEELMLSDFTTAMIKKLAPLKKLRKLSLFEYTLNVSNHYPDAIQVRPSQIARMFLERGHFVNDSGLELIVTNFPDLKVLKIGAGVATPSGLKHLAKLSSLEELAIGDYSDANANSINDLGEWVPQTPVLLTNEFLNPISNLKNLRSVRLNNFYFSPGGIAHLLKLDNLEKLYLEDHDMGPTFFVELEAFSETKLKFLSLRNTRFNEQDFPQILGSLEKITQLKELDLQEIIFTKFMMDNLSGRFNHVLLYMINLDNYFHNQKNAVEEDDDNDEFTEIDLEAYSNFKNTRTSDNLVLVDYDFNGYQT